jgi:hypothetical protein
MTALEVYNYLQSNPQFTCIVIMGDDDRTHKQALSYFDSLLPDTPDWQVMLSPTDKDVLFIY